MPTTPPRKRLAELTEEIRRAREEIEEILAQRSGSTGPLFESSRRLREDFQNVIALDEIRRAEKRAEDASEPTNAERFAEAMEAAFRRSRGVTTTDTPDHE